MLYFTGHPPILFFKNFTLLLVTITFVYLRFCVLIATFVLSYCTAVK